MSDLSNRSKEIISVYALVMVGALMMLVPYSLIPFAGIACMSVGLFAAYFYKWRHKEDEITILHMRYILRTVWWSTLILFVGVGLFASILVENGDLSAVHNLMANAEKGIIPTDADVQAMQLTFVHTNMSLIQWTALATLTPYPLYLIYRAVTGVKSLMN